MGLRLRSIERNIDETRSILRFMSFLQRLYILLDIYIGLPYKRRLDNGGYGNVQYNEQNMEVELEQGAGGLQFVGAAADFC